MFSQRLSVVFVDDSVTNAERFQELLGSGFEIIPMTSSAQATGMAAFSAGDIALVNAQYLDPEIQALAKTNGIPLVVFNTDKTQITGVDVCLIQPFEAEAVRNRLRALFTECRAPLLIRLADAIYQNVREGVMVTDADQRIVFVNPAFCQLTGYHRDEVIGKTPDFLKSGRHDEEFFRNLWNTLSTTGSWSGEIWNRMKNGELHPQLLTISQIANEAGKPSHYVAIWSDIRIIKDHQRKLEHLAYYDPLTELPNRSLLIDRIHQAIAYTLRAGGLLGIGFLDIDGYKSLTDRLGHQVGDRVLLEVSKRMTDLLRAGDTVARVGGDEFVFLLIGLENTEECETITGRIIKLLAETIKLPQGDVSITASIGLTFAPTDCINPETLLSHADEAMVAAKNGGKNGFRVYSPSDESVGC